MAEQNKSRIWDFSAIGMWWEVLKDTADTKGEYFEAINVVAPGFGGPPLHIHPTAEESYAIQSGIIDVCVAGQWRQAKAGETVVVPAGTPHTVRNPYAEEVRLINIHKPAMEFERFFLRLHALVSSGKAKLPPKDFGSLVLISMLFCAHEPEIRSVKPPHAVMRVLAMAGKMLGYRLPG